MTEIEILKQKIKDLEEANELLRDEVLNRAGLDEPHKLGLRQRVANDAQRGEQTARAQREVFALCPNADRARELIRAIYKAHNRKAPDL